MCKLNLIIRFSVIHQGKHQKFLTYYLLKVFEGMIFYILVINYTVLEKV